MKSLALAAALAMASCSPAYACPETESRLDAFVRTVEAYQGQVLAYEDPWVVFGMAFVFEGRVYRLFMMGAVKDGCVTSISASYRSGYDA